MLPERLKIKLESLAPGTRAQVTDLTGTQDHFRAVVVSPAFAGKTRIEQHRMIMLLMKPELDSNDVHALTLETSVPE